MLSVSFEDVFVCIGASCMHACVHGNGARVGRALSHSEEADHDSKQGKPLLERTHAHMREPNHNALQHGCVGNTDAHSRDPNVSIHSLPLKPG